MTDKSYDAIVIGGGPGGYMAAIRLGQLGQKTLVVERESIGGVCLNWGCIPSKALIHAAGLVAHARAADAMGIKVSGIEVDSVKMQSWKESVVKRLTTGVAGLIKGNGGTVVSGSARLTGAHTVLVEKADGKSESYVARKGIIIATGTTVIELPTFKFDGKTIISAKEAVSLQEVPKTLVVIGGGIIGFELGSVYQKLGSKVIVIEMLPRILAGVDEDLVKVVEKRFIAAGGEILTNAKASGATVKDGIATIEVEHAGSKRKIEADKVLVAVGFRPRSKELGLEEFGIKTDERGHILVDEQLRTNVPVVFAVGDVTGTPYLAHRAYKQGEVAAEVIAGKKAACDYRAMPSAIFTDPEIATVGVSETEAKEKGLKVKIGKFPLVASGRALALHDSAGFVKTLVDEETGQVIGAGIVGPEASELIAEPTLAIEMCAYAEDVTLTVHAHPTLGEAVAESLRHAYKEALHILNK
jgi:dihydrolipoamide dehydrogenase